MCCIFLRAEGVEGLLHMKDRFNQAVEVLELNTRAELFNNFEQVLSDMAFNHWMNRVTNLTNAQRMPARFDTNKFSSFLRKFTTNRGQDYMLEYLNSLEVQKPHDVECNAHAERISALV